jgi:hypothetical protein
MRKFAEKVQKSFYFCLSRIVLKESQFKVHKIEKLKEGVQVLIKSSDNKISVLSKHGKAIVFGLEECEKVLLGLRR